MFCFLFFFYYIIFFLFPVVVNVRKQGKRREPPPPKKKKTTTFLSSRSTNIFIIRMKSSREKKKKKAMKKQEGKKKKRVFSRRGDNSTEWKMRRKKGRTLERKKKKDKEKKTSRVFRILNCCCTANEELQSFFFFSFNRIYLRNGIRVASKKNTCSVKKKVWKKKRSYKKREISWFFWSSWELKSKPDKKKKRACTQITAVDQSYLPTNNRIAFLLKGERRYQWKAAVEIMLSIEKKASLMEKEKKFCNACQVYGKQQPLSGENPRVDGKSTRKKKESKTDVDTTAKKKKSTLVFVVRNYTHILFIKYLPFFFLA